MPTPIFRQPITHESAWTGPGVGGKTGLEMPLGPRQLRAIEALVRRNEGKPTLEIERADWDHPDLNPFLAGLKRTILKGRGIAIVTGITRADYDEAQFATIYWGVGRHLGRAVMQSQKGDRIGYVQADPSYPVDRGYLSNVELSLHTDTHEILGLMGVRQAASGGESRMASALAIHNAILAERPDLLEPLYEGYYYATPEMAALGREPVTRMKIPVFSNVGGQVSCHFLGGFMRKAAERQGVELPARLDEAIAYFRATSERDDIRARFLLEPGEMMLWSNYTVLHARQAFTDEGERRRLLYRLWMDVDDDMARPICEELASRIVHYDLFEQAFRERRLQPAQ